MGADFLGRSVRSVLVHGVVLVSPDYIAVEVAFFRTSKDKFPLRADQFTLSVHGNKLAPVSAGYVTMSLSVPGTERVRPAPRSGGGIGAVVYTEGQPPNTRRFPGDNNPESGATHEQTPFSEDEIVDTVRDFALPEGNYMAPVGGWLYCAYSKKLKSIKHLTLVYSGPLGDTRITPR